LELRLSFSQSARIHEVFIIFSNFIIPTLAIVISTKESMKINITVLFAISLIAGSCNRGVGNQIGAPFEKGEVVAELTNNKLKETSGLAASITNPQMLWIHNDKGNNAEIYLVDKSLNIQLTVILDGVSNRDWEDITIGPGPDSTKTYLYVGDIGDNDAIFPFKNIYRFVEPTFQDNNEMTISNFDIITFKLEGSVKDTESLFIDAKSKNLYLISKREEPVFLYELKYPQLSGDTLTASKMFSLAFKEIVGADRFSKNGDMLMKNYTNIYYWENKNSEDVLTLLKQNPIEIPYEKEPQGEAIAWATDGAGFYTLSEKKKKESSYLYFYKKSKN
jgi:hypothetical protein